MFSAYTSLVKTLLKLFGVENKNHIVDSIGTAVSSSKDDSISSHVINVSTNTQSVSYSLYDEGNEYFYEPFEQNFNNRQHTIEFLMSWNRRISESHHFFYLMKSVGFKCYHHGKCIYSFVYPQN